MKFWSPELNFWSHWRPGRRNFGPWKRVTLGGLWVRAKFLYNIGHWPLYLSQVKLCGLELSAGAVFINVARYIQTQMSTQLNGLMKGI